MLKVRNLTESLEKKYNIDEAYEHEMEDELDYIMDDDSLSDDEKEKAISDLYSKYKLEGYNRSNSLTEAYRFKVIPEDPDRWGCSTEEEFQDILNLENEEIVKIIKSTDGAPYYDITFANGEQLYGVAQNCIYTSTNESYEAVPMQGATSWGAKKLWDIIL